MVVFDKACKLKGINVASEIDVPLGAKGVILSCENDITIALVEPESLKGIICSGPYDFIKQCITITGDDTIDVILKPHRGIGHEVAKIHDTLVELGHTALAQELITFFSEIDRR